MACYDIEGDSRRDDVRARNCEKKSPLARSLLGRFGRRELHRLLLAGGSLFCAFAGSGYALAADEPPAAPVAAAVTAPAPSGRSGPLASVADELAEYGLTFHALMADFFVYNPTSDLGPGNTQNSLYTILGVDADISKYTGTGTSLHFETTLFSLNSNLSIYNNQVADSLLGYEATFNNRPAVISVATVKQTLHAWDGDFTFEAGLTHPNRYYATPLCNFIDNCFQAMFPYNANWSSPQYAVWGGNLSYKTASGVYAEAGVFGSNSNPRVGYDIGKIIWTGVLGMAEIGRKTDFTTDEYPNRFSLTGFFVTAAHNDLNSAVAFGATPFRQQGTSGAVIEGEQTVWRSDAGPIWGGSSAPANLSAPPTFVSVFGTFGAGFDSTFPISTHLITGVTLHAPFEGRPSDTFSLAFHYQRLNPNYTDYLAAANFVSGGSGAPYHQNEYEFEGNAHFGLPYGVAFETSLQYRLNLDTFYEPFTPLRPHNGLFVEATLIIPVGVLLGLTAPQ